MRTLKDFLQSVFSSNPKDENPQNQNPQNENPQDENPKVGGLQLLICMIMASRRAILRVEQNQALRDSSLRQLKDLQDKIENSMRTEDLQSQRQLHPGYHSEVLQVQGEYKNRSQPETRKEYVALYLEIMGVTFGPSPGDQVDAAARASVENSIVNAVVESTRSGSEKDIDKIVDDLLSNCFPPTQGALSRGLRILWPWRTTSNEAEPEEAGQGSQHDVRPSATWTVRTSGIYSGIDVEAESSSET